MRDPFHDLRHADTGASSHIRLISEGGSTHARSPELVCIDSIQATQTCTTEAHHTVYRAQAACSISLPGEAPICTVSAGHAGDLDREQVPEVLRQRLERLGHGLTPAARVSQRTPGRLWCISDQDRCYSVRKMASRIAIFSER